MKKRQAGSIEERERDRRYLIRWTTKDTTGKAIRHNRTVLGDYIEAQSELSRELGKDETDVPKRERTFASYAELEWKQYTDEKWKWTTQITQGSYVAHHIRPFFDNLKLSKITTAHIAAWHRWLAEKKLSSTTRRNVYAILHTMFAYASDGTDCIPGLELIEKSPIKRGMAPKREKHEKPALTPDQAWLLWDALKAEDTIRFRAFYGVLLFTGIRTSEALGLRWEDLDYANHRLNIRRAVIRGKETTPKTTASLRVRPMPAELHQALLNHKVMSQYTEPNHYIFTSSTGHPANPDVLRTLLQTVLRDKLRMQLGARQDGLHLLRHTSGSLVFHVTGNVKETQAWLGHSSSRITMDTYVHRPEQSQSATADAVFARPVPLMTPREKQN